jgi:uncharacterized protein (TIGR03437 family)
MVQTPTISFNGINGNVVFAGLTLTGLYQFNVTIPSNSADGEVVVLATTMGVTAPPATLTIRQ